MGEGGQLKIHFHGGRGVGSIMGFVFLSEIIRVGFIWAWLNLEKLRFFYCGKISASRSRILPIYLLSFIMSFYIANAISSGENLQKQPSLLLCFKLWLYFLFQLRRIFARKENVFEGGTRTIIP